MSQGAYVQVWYRALWQLVYKNGYVQKMRKVQDPESICLSTCKNGYKENNL